MKPKKIKINNEEYMLFIPVNTKDEIFRDNNSCSLNCPYGLDICMNLPSPVNPEETFTEFCSNLSIQDEDDELDEDMDDLEYYCPAKGSLEKLYPNLLENIFKKQIKSNPYVRIGDVIDIACKDTCPLYNTEHSNCTRRNEFCLFRNLIKLNKEDE